MSADSDIEGMEVIGEDGENLEDEDMETLDEAEKEEDGEEEEEDIMGEAAERTESPEDGRNKNWTLKLQNSDRQMTKFLLSV